MHMAIISPPGTAMGPFRTFPPFSSTFHRFINVCHPDVVEPLRRAGHHIRLVHYSTVGEFLVGSGAVNPGIRILKTIPALEAAVGIWVRRTGAVGKGRWGGILGAAAGDGGGPGALDDVRATPEVVSAAFVDKVPIRHPWTNWSVWDPESPPDETQRAPLAFARFVTPSYFDVMGFLFSRGETTTDGTWTTLYPPWW
jgi:hypothetical protein